MYFEDATATTTSVAGTSATNGLSWQEIWDNILYWLTNTGIRIVIALIILFIAFKLINFVANLVRKRLIKKNADPTISKVLVYVIKVGAKVLTVVVLMGYVGIQTTAISAVIAAAGLGISAAFQGTLSNVVGGMVIVIMRPFKLGDFITSNGQSGTVEDIRLFYTYITTPDNKVIYIPNGTLANNVIVNVSVKETRRVDATFSVSYETNTEFAKNLIKKVANSNPYVLQDPAVFVDITEYGESSISLTTRAWVKKENYWNVYFYLLNEVKKEFDNNGIIIPFNQLDVTIKNPKELTLETEETQAKLIK